MRGDLDSERLLADAMRAADLADAVSVDLAARRLDAPQLKDDGSLLTEADLKVEQVLRERLLENCPQASFVGEESSSRREVCRLQSGDIDGWLIDPIDQTRHFVRGDPEYATLIAYLRDGKPLLSVISAPRLETRAWAVRRGGAFVNGKRLRVSPRPLSEAEVAFAGFTEWSNGRADMDLTAVLDRCAYPHGSRGGFWQQLRVARGVLEASIEPWGEPWDHIPGSLIVEEAGGRTSSLAGESLTNSLDGGAVFGNGLIFEELMGLLCPGVPIPTEYRSQIVDERNT